MYTGMLSISADSVLAGPAFLDAVVECGID
jgi:hypothetical protein